MNIYKIATGILFDLEKAEAAIRTDIKDIENYIKMGKSYSAFFKDTIAPILLEIHTEFRSKMSEMSEVEKDTLDDAELLKTVREITAGLKDEMIFGIIESAGLKNFFDTEFVSLETLKPINDLVEKVEKDVREKTQVQPTPLLAAKSYEVKLQELKQKRTTEERAAYIISEFLPEEKVKYFDGLNYLTPSGMSSQNVSILVRNLKESLKRLDTPNNKSPTSSLYNLFKDDIIELINLSEGKISLEDLDEGDEEDEVDGEGEGEEEEEEQEPAAGEVIVEESTLNTTNVFTANPFLEEALSKEVGDRLKNQNEKSIGFYTSPFIDFPSATIVNLNVLDEDLPKFHEQALKSFNSNLHQQIERLYKSLVEDPSKVSPQSVNDLIYTIKQADATTYKSLNSYISKIKEFGEDQRGHVARAERVKDEFENLCMSKKIISSSELSQKIMTICLAKTSPKVANFIGIKKLKSDVGGKSVDLSSQKDAILQEYFKKENLSVRTEDFSDIINKFDIAATNSFKSKLDKFMDLEYAGSFNNFLSYAALDFNFTMKITLQNTFHISREYVMRPCPVCYKVIPVKFSADSTDNTSFKISVVSPFKVDKAGNYSSIEESELIGKVFKITDRYLNNFEPKISKSKATAEEASRKYIEGKRVEFDYLNNLARNDPGKTWQEIQNLVSSNYIEKQREGWHRRASALLESGGTLLSTQKNIKDLMVRCPAKPISKLGGPSSDSFCGAKVTQAQSDVLSPRLSFQPQFNGTFRSPNRDIDIPATIPPEEGWTSQNYQNITSAVRPGYKFSSFSFSCPCRIQNPTKNDMRIHKNIVFAKDLSNMVYPTNPQGGEDKIPEGTRSFMVCGTATSISSFNRNESEADKFILEVLLSTAQASIQDYYKFLNYLVDNGLDPQDAMSLDSDLKKYIQKKEQLEKTSSDFSDDYNQKIKDRISKISKLISTAGKRELDPNKRLKISDVNSFMNTLDRLSLVCPFGHKFTIGQSRRFGEAYSSYYSSSIYKYYNLISTEGVENEEAVNKSEILKKKPRGFKDVAWSKEESQESRLYFSGPAVIGGKIDVADITGDDEDGGVGIEGIGDNRESEDEGFISQRNQIPGTNYLDELGEELVIEDINKYDYRSGKESFKKAFENITRPKFIELMKIIKKSLLLVNTYTHGVVSDSVALLNQIKSEKLTKEEAVRKVSIYREDIVSALNKVKIDDRNIFEIYDDSELVDNIVKSIADQMMNILSYVVEATLDIKELGESLTDQEVLSEIDKSVAFKILNYSIYNVLDSAELKEDEDEPDPEDLSEKVANITDEILSKSNNFINNIIHDTSEKAKARFENVFAARLVTVAFAINIAKGFSALYRKYFDKNSVVDYLGFDLGVDLSNYEILLNAANANQIPLLTARMPDKFGDLIKTQKDTMFPKKEGGSNAYPIRMDSFYREIISLLNNSKSVSSGPTSIFEANRFLKEKIAAQIPDVNKAKKAVDTFTSNIPSFNFRMVADYSDDPQSNSYRTSPTRNRIPFFSQQPSSFENFEVRDSWIAVLSGDESKVSLLPQMPRYHGFSESEVAEKAKEGEKALDQYFSSFQKHPSGLRRGDITYNSQVEDSSNLNFKVIPTTINRVPLKEDVLVKFNPELPIFRGVKSIEIQKKISEGSNALNEAFKKYPEPPTDRKSLRYEVLRDNYVVSNNLQPSISKVELEKSGSFARLTFINMPTNNFDIGYDGKVLEKTKYSLAPGDLTNSYVARIQLPERITGTLEPSSFNFYLVANPGEILQVLNPNFDSRNVQCGTNRPKDKYNTFFPDFPSDGSSWAEQWNKSYRTSDVTGGWSDAWIYIGINLPLVDTNPSKNKPSVSKAGNIPFLNYRVMIDFEGSPLDISCLMLKGRTPYSQESIDKYNEWLNLSPKEREEQGSFKPPSVVGDAEKIFELEEQSIKLINQLKNASKSEADKIKKKIKELADERNLFQARLVTTPSYLSLSNSGSFPRVPSNKKKYTAADSYSTVTTQLVNPFHAFRIINNPSIAGVELDAVQQSRLKKFVVNAYNFQTLINYLNTLGYNIEADDLFDQEKLQTKQEEFEEKNKDLIQKSKSKKSIIGIINHFLENSGWHEQPGQFFNVIPGSRDVKSGSYIQFLFRNEGAGRENKAPNVEKCITEGARSNSQNMLYGRTGKEELDNLANRLLENSVKYLTDTQISPIVPKINQSNKASDNLFSENIDYNNNSLRRSKLLGIINNADTSTVLFQGLPPGIKT